MVVGIDIGSQTHYARDFDNRGRELTKRVFSFQNDIEEFNSFYFWTDKLKRDDCKTVVMIGCETRGHYWFALAKYVQDHQMKFVMVNPFSVKKIKELDDNSPKKNGFQGSENDRKAGCEWKIFNSIHARRYLC